MISISINWNLSCFLSSSDNSWIMYNTSSHVLTSKLRSVELLTPLPVNEVVKNLTLSQNIVTFGY